MDLYFADAFKVKASALDRHGAFNISLVADLPLFVDPFLIFNSRRPRYRKLHKEIVKYLRFLHSKARTTTLTPGLISSWYRFPEIKENWLGFSQTGNDGRGLGPKFATALHNNLGVLFHGLTDVRITKGVHLEKLCLVSDRVGRDNISDFTTNLIHRFLCEYTSEFAKKYIDKSLRRRISVSKVRFNYTTETWQSGIFEVPIWKGEHVLLTPKDLLTKDDTWINKTDLYEDFDRIPDSIANDQLRQQIHNYFTKLLPKPKKKRRIKKEERLRAIVDTLRQFPELIDYYIKNKEERGSEAEKVSDQRVQSSEQLYVRQAAQLVDFLASNTQFYSTEGNAYDAAHRRAVFLMKMLQPARGAAAFRALIGPDHEIFPEQLAKGCQTFYRGLFSRAGDGNEAFRAMNDAVDATKPTFFAISAEGALKMVFRGYLQELCTPGEIDRRVDAMEAKALQQRRDDGLPDMFSKDKQWARRLLRDGLLNHPAHFERIRRDFFFIDQFPENDQRFDVKFEDCQPSQDAPVQA